MVRDLLCKNIWYFSLLLAARGEDGSLMSFSLAKRKGRDLMSETCLTREDRAFSSTGILADYSNFRKCFMSNFRKCFMFVCKTRIQNPF